MIKYLYTFLFKFKVITQYVIMLLNSIDLEVLILENYLNSKELIL